MMVGQAIVSIAIEMERYRTRKSRQKLVLYYGLRANKNEGGSYLLLYMCTLSDIWLVSFVSLILGSDSDIGFIS